MTRNQQIGLVAGGILLTVVAVVAYLNLRGYGELSPKAYAYSKALYSICNRQDEQRLAKVEKMIVASEMEGDISSKESLWLQDVIARARDGDWDTATKQARRMMMDQVN